MTLSRSAALVALLALAACQSAAPPGAPMPAAPDGAAFLASNASAPGVVSADGLEYKVLASGPAEGPRPTPSDTIVVEYEGRLLNGQVFDATKPGEPATFQLGSLIPGWIAALQKMRPGDEWQVWIPPELGYGAGGAGPIPPNSVLVFRLKLVAVRPAG